MLVDSITALAAALGIERRRFYDLMHTAPFCPDKRADGKYDLEEWVEWRDSQAVDESPEVDDEMQRLKRENLRLKNDLTRHELEKKKGALVPIDEHAAALRLMYDCIKPLFVNIPESVGLITTDEIVRNRIRQLCAGSEEELHRRLCEATEKAEAAHKALAETNET